MLSLHSVIADVVEGMLPRFSGKLALRMIFDLRVNRYATVEDDEDEYQSQLIELTFHRPSNYTKVYVRTGADRLAFPNEWIKRSDHDSCWRGAVGAVAREESGKLFKKLRIDKGADESMDFSMFDGKPAYVTIEDAKPIDEVAYQKRWILVIDDRFDFAKLIKSAVDQL